MPVPSNSISGDVRLVNDRDQINALRDHIVEGAEGLGYPKAACFAIRLALEEAIVNAFKHGHRTIPDKPIHVTFGVTPARVDICVEDQGPGFDPDAVPDPTESEQIDAPSGRGLFLMRAYMSEVSYNPRGNCLRLRYERPGE